MKRIFFTLLIGVGIISAEQITVFNMSDQELYGAVYSAPKVLGKATRVTPITTFAVQAGTQIDRTPFYPGYDRELVMSTNKTIFQSEFTNREAYDKAVRYKFNIGGTKGTIFYVEVKNGEILGYTKAAWDHRGEKDFSASLRIKAEELGAAAIATFTDNWIIQKANSSIDGVVAYVNKKYYESMLGQLSLFWQSPFKNTVATVRTDNALSADERLAMSKRLPRVQAALQKKLGPIKTIPKIAVVASGGGYRSMISSLGFLVGAEKSGLLDSVMWITSLSGSTWGIASWLQNNAIKGRLTVEQYREQFFSLIKDKKLQSPLTKQDMNDISNWLLSDGISSKPMTMVNLYGGLLANRLFSNFPNRQQNLKLSDQRSLFAGGSFPIPIYTAASGEAHQTEYYWYAYTPWEISLEPWKKGSYAISMPTWGCGRAYENGRSTGFVPEQSLGFHLGTFGSAFAVNAQVVEENVGDLIPSAFVRDLLKVISTSQVGQERLSWGAIHNFMKGVKESPFTQDEALRIVDAGFAFNLPYPPVSGMRKERFADIVIILDASDVALAKNTSPELRKMIRYAESKELKLPKMNLDQSVDRNAVTIFESTDPSVPTIIYMPAINDVELQKKLTDPLFKQYAKIAGFSVADCVKNTCASFNFQYTYDQAIQLSMVSEFNVVANSDRIFEAIGKKIGVEPKVPQAPVVDTTGKKIGVEPKVPQAPAVDTTVAPAA